MRVDMFTGEILDSRSRYEQEVEESNQTVVEVKSNELSQIRTFTVITAIGLVLVWTAILFRFGFPLIMLPIGFMNLVAITFCAVSIDMTEERVKWFKEIFINRKFWALRTGTFYTQRREITEEDLELIPESDYIRVNKSRHVIYVRDNKYAVALKLAST